MEAVVVGVILIAAAGDVNKMDGDSLKVQQKSRRNRKWARKKRWGGSGQVVPKMDVNDRRQLNIDNALVFPSNDSILCK